MYSVLLHVAEAERELVSALLWEAGTAGIAEEAAGLRGFFEVLPEPELFAPWQPELRQEPEIDWQRESEAAWEPFTVGQRWWLAPEWRLEAAPEGRLRLTIYPGLACGTGAAPATQLCLEAMEETELTGRVVLDVGTGTGILAEAARLLGAARVVACDIDPAAASIARRNLDRQVQVFAGSLRALRSESCDAVVANLNAATLAVLWPEMQRVARPGGVLIAAGFREWEEVRGRALAEKCWNREGWSALRLVLR